MGLLVFGCSGESHSGEMLERRVRSKAARSSAKGCPPVGALLLAFEGSMVGSGRMLQCFPFSAMHRSASAAARFREVAWPEQGVTMLPQHVMSPHGQPSIAAARKTDNRTVLGQLEFRLPASMR